MIKKFFIIFIIFIMLFSTLLSVSAEENTDNDKVLVDINVVIDTPYPDDFYEDIVLYLTKDGSTVDKTLLNINNYKANFTIEAGIYSVGAKITGDLAEFYYISEIPTEIEFVPKNTNVAQLITIVVSENKEMFEDVTLEIGEESIINDNNDEINNETVISSDNTKIDDELVKENKWLTIIVEGVVTVGFLLVAYVVLKKKFDN